jgi:myosin heavy subunit
MLIRISLILAIVTALAVAALNFTMVKNKITDLQHDRDTEKAAHQEFQTKYTSTKKDLDKTTAQLVQTNNALVATITERDQAIATAETAKKQAADLGEKLAKTTKELGDAKDELAAYHSAVSTPALAAALAKDLKTAQDNLSGAFEENKVLHGKMVKLQDRLDKYEKGMNRIVYLPPTLHGKIVVSDPKWDFVVVDVGETQGVKQDGELLVSRNGKLVAKVVVRSVQKDRSIANVMPGWKLGEVLEGDQVIPAHPES